MPSKEKCLFISLQTFFFLFESELNSPNSDTRKALQSVLKTISQSSGWQSTYWTRKLPNEHSILLITTWSCENDEVEFFASETWMSALNELQNHFLSPSLTSIRSSDIRFPQSYGVGSLRSGDAQEHEILTFKFPVNAAAAAKSISEFNSRVSNLFDGLFNNIGMLDFQKPRLEVFICGWVHRSDHDHRESTSRIYVMFLSWGDERKKKTFKSEDEDWLHFWRKVEGLFERVETEQFSGRLERVFFIESCESSETDDEKE